jgi:hypothetical protein
MRAFTVKRSDIQRCPRRSLAVEHYRDDGWHAFIPTSRTDPTITNPAENLPCGVCGLYKWQHVEAGSA